MMAGIKRRLATRAPSLAAAYHAFRSARMVHRDRATSTPFGFKMQGHAGMQSGGFECEETALVQERLPEIDVFIDVGANVGLFSCMARQAGARVLAVEPSPQNLDFLLKNLVVNGWSDVEVYPLALGNAAGITALFGDGTGASVVPRWSGTSDAWQRLVPVSTLDLLLACRFPLERLMIKIDAEGYEYEILAGAGETLRRRPSPIWLLEVCLTEHHPGGVNPHFAEIFECFWHAGYVARTADQHRRFVGPDDVAEWVGTGRRSFGSINFFFSRHDST
jgi:FkbM family methyltransferase